jgi:hypothetical protein
MIEGRKAILGEDDVTNGLPRQGNFAHLVHRQALNTEPPDSEHQRQPAHEQRP